jgi:multicomponent Na+:H+ antiporter subunit D
VTHDVLLTTPVLVPLLTALLAALFGDQRAVQRVLSLLGAFALLVCTIVLLTHVRAEGTLRVAMGNWPAPFGIELVADPLGATMALITATMGMATTLYMIGDVDAGRDSATRIPLVFALLAGVGGAFITGDVFNLYVWFELMLVAALGLLAHGNRARNLEATLKYFVLNALGTLLFLMGVAYLYAATGHLGFGALAKAARELDPATWLPFVVLLVLAALVKAGAFPVFAWLPASYHTLPAPILALFAGLLTKVGVYTVLRFLGDVFAPTPEAVFDALGLVAVPTMLFGVFGAAYHWDMRRILAFHSLSQIGYMLLGISLASAAGYVGTIVYVVHHALVKANLFLIAGIVSRLTGSYDLRRCGGLYAKRPFVAVLFGLSALSLVGIPPSSGFWAKFLVVRETIVQGHVVLATVALAVGLLTLYSMMKIWFQAFWKKHPDADWAPPRDARLGPAYAVTTILVLLALGIGLWPEGVLVLANEAVVQFGEVP